MKRILSAAIIVSVASLALAADKVDIKPLWNPGQYVQTVDVSMDQSTEVGPQKSQQHIEALVVSQLDVQPGEGGQGKQVTMTVKRVRQALKGGPRGDVSFDSMEMAGAVEPAFAPIAAMIDMPLVITLDEQGKVLKVAGMDAVWEKLAKTNPQMAAAGQEMKDQMGRQMFDQMQAIKTFPQQPLAKGESWKGQTDMPTPILGVVQLQQVFTVEDIRTGTAGREATVQYSGSFEKDDAETQPATQPAGAKVNHARVQQDGQMIYDEGMGAFRKTKTNQTGTLSATLDGPDGKPMQFDMQQKGTVTTSLEKGAYKAPTTAATAPATKPS